MIHLEGKVALITGGTRGIGKSIVQLYHQLGAKVYFTYSGSTELAQQLEQATASSALPLKGVKADVADHALAADVVNDIVKSDGRLDVLVNNAGITRDTLLLRMSETQWDEVMLTNLKSVFNYTKAATRHMIKQRAGSLIHMSSVVGVSGNAGQANYAASKAGIIAFSRSVALELGSRNVRSNVVAPGFIATEMTAALPQAELQKWLTGIPLGRAGTPEEVAQLCAFLGADASAYLTGQVIRLDGGMP